MAGRNGDDIVYEHIIFQRNNELIILLAEFLNRHHFFCASALFLPRKSVVEIDDATLLVGNVFVVGPVCPTIGESGSLV